MHRPHVRQVPLGVLADPQRLSGQARRTLASGQFVMRQVIVEDHIADVMLRDHPGQGVIMIQHRRLEPELQDQVGDHPVGDPGHARKDPGREIRPPHTAFPAPELRQHRRGDPVGGQFGLGSDQPFAHFLHGAPARCQVLFEPVAMDVHDPRHHQVATQVHLAPRHILDHHAARDSQGRLGQRALHQHPRAHQPQVQRAHSSPLQKRSVSSMS